jgi:hypothetical protein
LRPDGNGALQQGLCLHDFAVTGQLRGQVYQRIAIAWISHGVGKVRTGARGLTQQYQHIATVAIGFGQPWAQGNGAVEIRKRLRQLLLVFQQDATVDIGFGQVRCQRNGTVEMGERPLGCASCTRASPSRKCTSGLSGRLSIRDSNRRGQRLAGLAAVAAWPG